MIVLALDTSMGKCSAALLRQEGGAQDLVLREEAMARGHAEALMPMIEAVMRDASTPFAHLDRVAATTGPGSFTGVRIAIAAAQGLALATKVELWGTDSLRVMARRAVMDELAAKTPFAIAVDARRGMLYWGRYTANGDCLAGPELVSPETALASLPDDASIVLGSGALLLQAAADQAGRTIEAAAPGLQPDAAALAILAVEAGAQSTPLRPLYLRPPDAKPQTGKSVERC